MEMHRYLLVAVLLCSSAIDAQARGRSGARVETVTFRYLVPRGSDRPAVSSRHPRPPPLIPLPQTRQHSGSACGIYCVQSLSAYAGKPTRRGSQLIRQAKGYSYEIGTPEQTMGKLARKLGLKVQTRTRMKLSQLVSHVSNGRPVVVGLQAWVDNPKQVNWRKEQDSGHYAVVIGIGDRKGNLIESSREIGKKIRKQDAFVWFMDPSMDLGKRGYIPLKEFVSRWHWPSESGKSPSSRFGMALMSHPRPAQISAVTGVGRIE